jgi:hypothetical protein
MKGMVDVKWIYIGREKVKVAQAWHGRLYLVNQSACHAAS